ncbi:Pisatin demethylase [Cyphellophora attinorum]|uniref:Pisatin demethylase n=1 Tax=Cyphellophora attinorum TaxID=1664694 RepID=A0A0N1H206_9EURO|nr:Pisatin demethylase [Phialophora attinorum]KPI38564.1 Pisatin demethylase [Phialophora attinorum]
MAPKPAEDAPVTQAAIVGVLAFITAHPYLILLSLLVFRPLFKRYASPLRQYPGPFIASCTRLWKVWSTWTGKTEQHHIALHKRYGPVVRIAPNELSFANPHAALAIFQVGKGFHKTDFYGVFPPPENPDIFTETRESVHGVKKRYAATPYSMATMQQSTSRIEETERLLIRKMDDFADGFQVCDLGDWLHWFAFDVLGEVAFSKKFGFLEAGKDVDGAIKTIDDSQWYNGIDPENKETYKDLLNSLIEAQTQNPDKLGEGDVFAIAHGAIFAGSDSTASTMQSFCWNVLNNPDVYRTLMDEILAADMSEMVQYNEAQNLPYFQACLKEAMRLQPAVGLNITRKVPAQGAEIHGTKLPGGVNVAVNGWVLHRDQEVFGVDAEIYNPSRWLVEDKEKLRNMDRCMFQFGGGSHVCIGRHLALLEMNKVLPQLLRRYELRLVNPGKVLGHHSSFFVVQWGLKVYLSKRKGQD